MAKKKPKEIAPLPEDHLPLWADDAAAIGWTQSDIRGLESLLRVSRDEQRVVLVESQKIICLEIHERKMFEGSIPTIIKKYWPWTRSLDIASIISSSPREDADEIVRVTSFDGCCCAAAAPSAFPKFYGIKPIKREGHHPSCELERVKIFAADVIVAPVIVIATEEIIVKTAEAFKPVIKKRAKHAANPNQISLIK